ncbi:KH domain-containing protein [Colletotrichum abscissum]|uniref:KH domain-containing protein n=1 Tax=Colletotrichum abscissum TaxID=1671311 RepID=A0A9P9XAZ0_9PEZI|nr:KH domain-containing protein [Colletotrichum abscissum]
MVPCSASPAQPRRAGPAKYSEIGSLDQLKLDNGETSLGPDGELAAHTDEEYASIQSSLRARSPGTDRQIASHCEVAFRYVPTNPLPPKVDFEPRLGRIISTDLPPASITLGFFRPLAAEEIHLRHLLPPEVNPAAEGSLQQALSLLELFHKERRELFRLADEGSFYWILGSLQERWIWKAAWAIQTALPPTPHLRRNHRFSQIHLEAGDPTSDSDDEREPLLGLSNSEIMAYGDQQGVATSTSTALQHFLREITPTPSQFDGKGKGKRVIRLA